MIDWRLYAILDPSMIVGRTIEDVCVAVVEGGAGVIQLRDKRSTTRETFRVAERICAICHERGAAFIVNDRVDLALAAGADGVHVGPDDLPVRAVKKIAPHLLVGASAGTADVARAAVEEGADYLGSGAVFDARGSKPDAVHDRGLAALADVVAAVEVPVVGIGGITQENAAQVAATRAAGIAVIRAICATGDPRGAASRLLREFSGGGGPPSE